MKRLLIAVLLLIPFKLEAKDLQTLRADFRKMSGDMSASSYGLSFPDTVVNYYLNAAQDEAALSALCLTRVDTLTMTAGTKRYATSRGVIKHRQAMTLANEGSIEGLPYVLPEDFWRKSQNEKAYTLYDSSAEVTQTVSEGFKLVVQYAAYPRTMSTDTANCEIPNGLEIHVVRKAVALAWASTKVPALLQAAANYDALAEARFQSYLQRHIFIPTDSAGIIK